MLKMKKWSLFIALAALTAGVMSCERDWTCVCETDASSGGDTTSIEIRNATKREATKICDDRSGDIAQNGVIVTTTCELQ